MHVASKVHLICVTVAFSAYVTFRVFPTHGALGHAIDVAHLVEVSDIVLVGQATSVNDEGLLTIETPSGSIPGKRLLAAVSPDEFLKGSVEPPPLLLVEFLVPEAPSAMRGIPVGQYGIFFLQKGTSRYRISDPLYPFLPVVRNGRISSGPPLDRVIAKLGETLTFERSTEVEITSALDALATIQRDSATQTLRHALETTSGELQLRIARQLVAHNDITGLDLVEKALTHSAGSSENVFLNLAGSLGGLKDPKAIPALKRLLETHDQHIIKGAAIALRQSRSADALEPLSLLLNNSDEQVRYYSVVGLGEITGQDEWTPAFNEFREHEAKYLSYWRSWATPNLPRNTQNSRDR